MLEYQDRILPGIDQEIAKEAQRLFEKQGLTFLLGSRVSAAKVGLWPLCKSCHNGKRLSDAPPTQAKRADAEGVG